MHMFGISNECSNVGGGQVLLQPQGSSEERGGGRVKVDAKITL